MQSSDMKTCARALDEVADILVELYLKHPGVFVDLRISDQFADELGGYACMLRDHAKLGVTLLSEAASSDRVVH